jgi:hypothetical protein
MINDELVNQFAESLQRLIEKECWGIVEGTGSHIAFDFGRKIPRIKPIENTHLSADSRNFESELSLFVECVWRIVSPTEVLFGSWTEHQRVKEEKIFIIGQKVKSVELIKPALDINVTFSNDLQLNIFCDQTNEKDSNDNYDYFTPEIIYTVGHKSILTTSKHK